MKKIKISLTAFILSLTLVSVVNADPNQQFPPECVDGWFNCIYSNPYQPETPEHAAYGAACVNSWLGCIGA